jgi:hypothetical protein
LTRARRRQEWLPFAHGRRVNRVVDVPPVYADLGTYPHHESRHAWEALDTLGQALSLTSKALDAAI